MNNSQFPDFCPIPPRVGQWDKVGQESAFRRPAVTIFVTSVKDHGVKRMFTHSLRVYHGCQAGFLFFFDFAPVLFHPTLFYPSLSGTRAPQRHGSPFSILNSPFRRSRLCLSMCGKPMVFRPLAHTYSGGGFSRRQNLRSRVPRSERRSAALTTC